MKKLRFFLLLSSLTFAACGGGGGGTPPPQADVDAAINDLMQTGITIGGNIDGSSCANFTASLAQFNGQPTNCDSGTVVLSTSNIQCNDSTQPLQATATVTVSATNCQDNAFGTTSNGAVQYAFTATGQMGAAQVSASSITINNIDFDVNNVGITFPTSGSPVCGGPVKANGAQCMVSADCTTCVF